MAADHPVFAKINARKLNLQNFDEALAAHEKNLVGIFFWGHDCPNCEVAKRMMDQDAAEVRDLGLIWFHVNTYEDPDLGIRFSLFGVPAFFFFHQGKKLGKISPFPGMEPFMEALRTLKSKTSALK